MTTSIEYDLKNKILPCCYGLTGTPEGYLWGLSYGSPGSPSFGDHIYSNDFSQPTDYAAQDIFGYLRQS